MSKTEKKQDIPMARCKVCGHIQECCAPPCERCQGMQIEEIKK